MKPKEHREGEKMLLSSRASPPKPLASLSQKNLSVRQLLLYSPIPSPALPALLPRHGKKPPPLNTRKVLSVLLWLAVLTTIYYASSLMLGRPKGPSLASIKSIPYLTETGKTYQIVGDSDLPKFATPLAVTDRQGRDRWTIYIPDGLRFPSPGVDLADICAHIDEVAGHIGDHKHLRTTAHHAHYHGDSNFIDIADAQADGLLPKPLKSPLGHGMQPVCEKSLTYILDSTEAGLGSTLLGLWLAYSLAKEEGRAFFIDDTTFAYGNYSTYFSVRPPIPNCRPPPATQRVPCPYQARHLVVSPATFAWSFGKEFQQHYTSKKIFEMVRHGHKDLFNLREDDGDYAKQRMLDLKSHNGGIKPAIIGMHVRRGDRHPFDFAYQTGYLPPHIYKEAAEDYAALYASSKIILASDDPEMYTHGELAGYTRAQERITLASKKSLSDNSVGWEGGFFKDLFWDLGLPLEAHEQRSYGSPGPTRHEKHAKLHQQSKAIPMLRDYRSQPTDEARKLREFIGRAYLLELSILGQSDRIVCAVSSYTCRILAVMMGWERAFERGHWRNVDGEYEWRGLDV